jgi:TetR/AcrR family transcriptional repressor of nem operon
MDLFWTHGYAATGMSALLRHMGVGRQSLYDTFHDKRSLFLEALDHYFRTRIGPVLGQLRAPGSPEENLARAFGMWIREAEQYGYRGCLMGRTIADLDLEHADGDLLRQVQGYLGVVRDAFTDLARRGQEAGEFTSRVSPEQLAGVLLTMNQGAAMMSKIDPEAAKGILHATLALLRPGPS